MTQSLPKFRLRLALFRSMGFEPIMEGKEMVKVIVRASMRFMSLEVLCESDVDDN